MPKLSAYFEYLTSCVDQDQLNEDEQLGLTFLLCKACAEGNYELARQLLTEDDAPADGHGRLTNEPLFVAIEACDVALVKLLVEHGANRGPRDLDKHSAPITREMWDILNPPWQPEPDGP